MSQSLFIVTLLLGGAITISGLYGDKFPHLGGIFGAISTAIIAYRGYAKNEVAARWFGKAINVCDALIAEVGKASTEAEFNAISDKLEQLRAGDSFWGTDPVVDKQPGSGSN